MERDIILTGSLAFDYVFDIPDPFSKYIQSDKIHKINISIVTDTHKKTFGGTAGNQAFYLALLGTQPYIVGSAGNDFHDYLTFLKKEHIHADYISRSNRLPTAAGFVMTDPVDNQIWMFATGAMTEARKITLTHRFLRRFSKKPFVMISPNDMLAMTALVEACVNYEVEFAFDPAFFIPHFPETTLRKGIKHAAIIFGNDYEIAFIEKRLKKNITSLVSKNQMVVKTLGNKGSEIYHKGKWMRIGIKKVKTVDPTGAGDAYRAGFLFGYLNNRDLKTCGDMGATTASFAVETKGTMNLKFNKKAFYQRLAALSSFSVILQ